MGCLNSSPTLPWIVRLLPALDTDDEAEQLTALRNLRHMLADARMSFADLAKLIRAQPAPHLEPGAPIDATTIGLLLDADINRVPLADLPALGDLQRRLRAGQRPTPEDSRRVQRVRQQVAGASA